MVVGISDQPVSSQLLLCRHKVMLHSLEKHWLVSIAGKYSFMAATEKSENAIHMDMTLSLPEDNHLI